MLLCKPRDLCGALCETFHRNEEPKLKTSLDSKVRISASQIASENLRIDFFENCEADFKKHDAGDVNDTYVHDFDNGVNTNKRSCTL